MDEKYALKGHTHSKYANNYMTQASLEAIFRRLDRIERDIDSIYKRLMQLEGSVPWVKGKDDDRF